MIIIYALVLLGIPALLSIINLGTLIESFTRSNRLYDYTRRKYLDVATIVLGVLFSIAFWGLCEFREYNDPIQISVDLFHLHTPIGSEHMLSVMLYFTFGYLAYLLLRFKHKALSPILVAVSISLLILSNLLNLIFIIQLSNHIFIDGEGRFTIFSAALLLSLLPANFFILSGLLIRDITSDFSYRDRVYKNPVLATINQSLIKSDKYFRSALILLFPLYGLLTALLVLFGQKPDSLIQAFTQTSDWTLSQHIAPPPVEVDAHYLCTVSLRGHKKIVKPLRYGVRKGNKIVVNRQLMVANAFEELIQERYPKMHKGIRYFYDRYGYPLSDLITNQYKADMTYLLMKPLEYVFLLTLYLFDKTPENRIALQYLPNDVKKSLGKSHL